MRVDVDSTRILSNVVLPAGCTNSPVGYAIWAKGTKVVSGPNYTVKIGGSFTPDEINYFSDCTGAVFTTDFLDLIVENNHFNNLTTNPASIPNSSYLS